MQNTFNESRRRFLKNAGKAGIAAGLSFTAIPSFAKLAGDDDCDKKLVGFKQSPLPYGYSALEPYIDAQTMEIHYTKHATGYAKNLADACKEEGVNTANDKELYKVLKSISKYSVKMRNNAGGHYNHELFWKVMSPKATQPSSKFLKAVERDFGSAEAMKKQFSDAAKTRFGSGWAWLMINGDKKLQITSTPNQDNPLMDVAEQKGTPVLGLDVWEHAYYLKYQNKRPDYIEAWWKLVNWDTVSMRYDECK